MWQVMGFEATNEALEQGKESWLPLKKVMALSLAAFALVWSDLLHFRCHLSLVNYKLMQGALRAMGCSRYATYRVIVVAR